MSHALPAELTSLIHYLHLNEAGWWDRGIRQLIVSIVWLGGSLSPQAISRALQEQYSIQLSLAATTQHIQVLIASGVLLEMPGLDVKISEGKLTELEKSLREAEKEDLEVRELFEQLLRTHCPELALDTTWKTFTEDLLFPLIRELGAKTYELISGTSHKIEDTTSFASFLEGFSSDTQLPMRTTIVEFLNPKNLGVRSYVLKNLNTYFFLEAGNMSQDTIELLLKLTDTGHTLKLFLDTNIIFSILGFHNNPSNEAVQSLLRVVKQLSEKVGIQFYVLPTTLAETKRSLDIKKLDLANVRLSTNIASVAAELEELSGASRKFAEASVEAGRPLTTEEYFGPFLDNLLTILRAHGVELYNDPRLNSYSTRQEVVDDVLTTEKFEQTKYGSRAKGYDKIVHDLVLWHFVSDLRPNHLEAPFEAEQWIVTIDYRLLVFDDFKQNKTTFRLPVCLHPSGLVQMLQFWVPRTAEFEKALITGFQLPFLFREFDIDAERVTIQILQTVARYENIESIPRETIGHIILNETLRQKIKLEKDEARQIQLVREAFLEVNLKLSTQLAQAEGESRKLQQEKEALASASENQLNLLQETVKSLKEDLGNQKKLLEQKEDQFEHWKAAQRIRANGNANIILNFGTVLVVIGLTILVYRLIEPVFDNWGWIEPIAWIVSLAVSLVVFLLGIKPWDWRSRLKARISSALLRRYLEDLWDLRPSAGNSSASILKGTSDTDRD